MHALAMQPRLRAVAELVTTWRAEKAIDPEMMALIRLAANSIELAALMAILWDQPGMMPTLYAQHEPRLCRAIERGGLTELRCFELLPRLLTCVRTLEPSHANAADAARVRSAV